MNTTLAALPKAPKIDLRKLPALAKQQIKHVNLPANYVAARTALMECVRVDECKDIADKHYALAHYAKQIKDDTLRYYAERVRLRALVRIGEILRDIKEPKERKALAKQHGMSYTAANEAVNMSYLTKKARDAYIEKSPPESKSALVWEGQKLRFAGS